MITYTYRVLAVENKQEAITHALNGVGGEGWRYRDLHVTGYWALLIVEREITADLPPRAEPYQGGDDHP